MRNRRRPRRLVVGDAVWLWTVRHRCGERGEGGRCREVLSLHREGAGETVRIVFGGGPGRFVPGYMEHTGSVGDGGHSLNLNEPGVVRLLLDEVAARGALPVSRGGKEIDGWPLFDALVGRDLHLG